MAATLRPTGGLQAWPLQHISAASFHTYMYVCMHCKCVSTALTTVDTPTETSARYHAVNSIITIPDHSTFCNDIMLQKHYNVGACNPESCLELVDIVVVRLLEKDQHYCRTTTRQHAPHALYPSIHSQPGFWESL